MKTLHHSEISLQEELLSAILAHDPGREIRVPIGPRWGRIIWPGPLENPAKSDNGLRVLAIASWTLGFLSLETLKSMERRHPERLNLTGLVTDDPVDRDAKISMKKRFWRYYEEHQQEEYERGILEAALTFGIPVYTGEVKNDYFRRFLKRLDPEVIIVSGFGQAIDASIIEHPPYGIYNVHPSDLLHGFGAGPQPWEDLISRKASATKVTLHHVSESIDDGHIVGQSPPINIRLKGGLPSENVRLIGEKTLVPVSRMVAELISLLIVKKESGLQEPINHIDFEKLFSRGFKEKLMEPIDPDRRGHVLPLPADELQYTV